MNTIKLTLPEWQTVQKAIRLALAENPEHYGDELDVWKRYEAEWVVDYTQLQALSDAVTSLRDEEGPDEQMCNHIKYDILEKTGDRLM